MLANCPTKTPLRILVTGAAGLIGGDLCDALARRGHAVAGLVRRRGRPSEDPIPAEPDCAPLVAGAVALFEGDVAEPNLGLPGATSTYLAAKVDLVVHCAALTEFNLPSETYRRVNTVGTARVLDFVGGFRPIPLLHTSTAYVCGMATGAVAEIATQADRFNNGYEASKAEAEVLVLAAQRSGGVIAVARPSVVVGRWADGATGAFSTIYQVIRLLTQGRIRVLPISHDASLDLVPIDHVVGGLIDIAERMTKANGQIFHLASGRPVPVTALLDLSAAFPHLQSPRLVPLEAFDPAALVPRERWLHDQLVDTFAAYLRPSPRFAVDNLEALSRRHCPPVDDAFLRRMIGFAVSAGFLRCQGVSGRPDRAGRGSAAARSPN